MKISDYYAETAKAAMNFSLLLLIPAVLLTCLNLFLINNETVMLLALPFMITSFIYFQNSLENARRGKGAGKSNSRTSRTIFSAKSILLLYEPSFSPGLLLFGEDGVKLGSLRKKGLGWKNSFGRKLYSLESAEGEPVAFFSESSNKIEVFNSQRNPIGYFCKKGAHGGELIAHNGDVAAITSERMFMDVKVATAGKCVCRLRRGMMPLGWADSFTDPNIPVLTFSEEMDEPEKLLYMSILIKEFFAER